MVRPNPIVISTGDERVDGQERSPTGDPNAGRRFETHGHYSRQVLLPVWNPLSRTLVIVIELLSANDFCHMLERLQSNAVLIASGMPKISRWLMLLVPPDSVYMARGAVLGAMAFACGTYCLTVLTDENTDMYMCT